MSFLTSFVKAGDALYQVCDSKPIQSAVDLLIPTISSVALGLLGPAGIPLAIAPAFIGAAGAILRGRSYRLGLAINVMRSLAAPVLFPIKLAYKGSYFIASLASNRSFPIQAFASVAIALVWVWAYFSFVSFCAGVYVARSLGVANLGSFFWGCQNQLETTIKFPIELFQRLQALIR